MTEEKGMILNEFIKDLKDEVKNNPKLGKLEVTFETSDREGLKYLSIYEDEGKVCIDIGEKDE